MATREDFEATITRDPDRADPYLVYADWLNERGDPRGELILLDYRIEAARRGDDLEKLRSARAALFAEHREALLGPLTDDAVWKQVEWRFGFIRAVEVAWKRDRRPSAFLPFLTALLEHPSSRFVEALRLEGPLPNFALWKERLEAAPETVRELSLGVAPYGSMPLDARNAGWLGQRFPQLRKLAIRGDRIGLDCERWPALEELTLAGDIDGTLLTQLQQFSFPRLQRLFLSMEGAAVRTDLFAHLRALLHESTFHELRHLHLQSHPFDNRAVLRALADAPFAHSLETLDLLGTELTDAALQVLREHRAAFPSLIALEVAPWGLSNVGRKDLEALRHELVPKAEALIRLARHGDVHRMQQWLGKHTGTVPIEPALFHAADHDHVEILNLLLDAGADPQAVDAGWHSTALGHAAMAGAVAAVSRLVLAGTRVDQADQFGYTPLLRAAAAGHPRVSRRLLDAGADPYRQNQDRNNAVMLAAAGGHADVIRVFMEEGVELGRGDGERTPLDEARIHGRQRVVELLTEAGAPDGITSEGYPLNWDPKRGRST